MPASRSFRRVLFVWLFLAEAFRRLARSISAAVRSSNLLEGRWPSHQYGINAANPVCTWHSVSPGFFPPELLSHPREEQIAHATEHQVASQTLVTPALVLVQADLRLLILETAFDPPTREGHQQHRGH